MESRQYLTTSVSMVDDSGINNYYIRALNGNVQIFQNQPLTAAPLYDIPQSDIGNISIACGSSQDSITVDYSNGDPIPHGLGYLSETTEPANAPSLHVVGLANAVYLLGSNYLNITENNTTQMIAFPLIGTLNSSEQFDLFSGGGTDLLAVSNSVVVGFNTDLGQSGTVVNLNIAFGAVVSFSSTEHLNSVNIHSGGQLKMLPWGGLALNANTLNNSGVIDLANNDLIIAAPTSSDMTTLAEQVGTGVTDAASSGGIGSAQGIIYSSTAGVDNMALGAAPVANLYAGPGELDGQTLASGEFIARYTLPGDVNLDGVVDGADISEMGSNYGKTTGTTPPEYDAGDINYDGRVDANDFGILGAQFNTALPAPADIVAGSPYALTLPATAPDGSASIRWDVSWGDGTFDSYANVNSVSHSFTNVGASGVIQAVAVTLSATGAWGSYHLSDIQYVIAPATAQTALVIPAAAADVFTITADGKGNTVITQNGQAIDTVSTTTLLSLAISGDTAGTVSVDYTNGDPFPSSGLTTDSQTINLTGGTGADTLATTGSAAIFSNANIISSEIRHRATASVSWSDAVSTDTLAAITATTFYNGTATAADGPAVLVDTSAELIFSNTTRLESLDVLPGGTARLAENGADDLITRSLTLQPPANGLSGGILDLSDNDLILHAVNSSSGSANLTAVQGWLAAGYYGGNWTDQGNYGNGPAPAAITSAVAANQIEQGYESLGLNVVGSPGTLIPGLFDGEPVNTGDIVIRFGLYGDANTDGQVTPTDYGIWSTNHDQSGTWFQGDFNYDGQVDNTDYSTLISGMSGGVNFTLPAAQENQPYSFTLPGDLLLNNLNFASIGSYQVRWGDGTATTYPVAAGDNPDITASHTYATPNNGMYQLAIVATGVDQNGNDVSYILPHQDAIVAPDAPTNLTATSSGDGNVDLGWSDDTHVASSFSIVVIDDSSGEAAYYSVPANTFSFAIPGLADDLAYSISVTAVNTLADGITANSQPAELDFAQFDSGGSGFGSLVTAYNINATANQAFSGTVGYVTGVPANYSAGDLSATIEWGDGVSTEGTLIAAGGGTCTISGSHTYDQPESGPLLVLVTQGTQLPSVGLGWATVSDNLTLTDPATAIEDADNTDVDLDVGATDSAGTDHLSYAWSVSGPNAAQVVFDDNNDNGASSTFATLTSAGTFTFSVTITADSGLSVTSHADVTVDQVLSDVTVAGPSGVPANTNGPQYNVSDGQTFPFTATADDQFGNAMSTSPTFTWNASSLGTVASTGGSIASNGVYTAPAAQVGTAIITASASDSSGNTFNGSTSIGVSSNVSFGAVAVSSTEIDVTIPPAPPGMLQQLDMAGPTDPNLKTVQIPSQLSNQSSVHPFTGLTTNASYAFRLRNESNGLVTYTPIIVGTLSNSSNGSSGSTFGSTFGSTDCTTYNASSNGIVSVLVWCNRLISATSGLTVYYTGGNAPIGNSSGGTITVNAPATVTAVPFEIDGSQAVRLFWDNTPDNESGFRISRSTDDGSTFTTLGTVPADIINYVDNSFNSSSVAGKSLVYEVQAFNGNVNSSSTSTATLGFPAQPTGLAAIADDQNADVNLEWTSPAPQFDTGYEVQWSIDNSTFYTVDTVPSEAGESDYTYTDDSATVNGNQPNYYRIVAYHDPVTTDSDQLESPPSDEDQATLYAAPVAFDDTSADVQTSDSSGGYFTATNKPLSVAGTNGVLANDYDPQQAQLTAVLDSSTQHGQLTLYSDGGFDYQADSGFTGTDSFYYHANNGHLDSGTALVDIQVANRPVITNSDSFSVAKGVSLTESGGALGANDVNPDGADVTYVLTAGVSHGGLTFNSDGSFTYTPAAGFAGLDHFSYEVTDGNVHSQPAAVIIGVGLPAITVAVNSGIVPANVPSNVQSFPRSLQGLWDSWTAARNRLNNVYVAMNNFGQAAQLCQTIDDTTAGTAIGQQLVDTAAALHQVVTQAYDLYTQQQQATLALCADYMKHNWHETANDFAAQNAIVALPTTIMGLRPNDDELVKYQQVFAQYGVGADFEARQNGLVADTARKLHDRLEQAIQVAGIASIAISGAEILTEQGCAMFVKYTMDQIAATATGVVYSYISSSAVSISLGLAQDFGIHVDPDYLRIAADGIQLFSLVRAARAERLARGSNCFAGNTLVDTTNHGEEDINQIHDGEQVDTSVSETLAQGGPAPSSTSATQVDPATWRQVDLTMPDPANPGDSYTMQLLEPMSWIAVNNAMAGNWVSLELPELQISGEAQVTSVDQCPTIESGSGQVVLGTFQHVSNDVVDVNLAGESQPLQVTAGHLLWSLDAGGWVAAGSLHAGERLAGENGPIVVASVTADSQPMPVYNLDVENDHRYMVTDLGVLAHNICPDPEPSWLKKVKEGRAFDKEQSKNYDYNQVYVDGEMTDYYKLDSYNPTSGEIVSRKLTQLGKIQPKTAFAYLNEFVQKYSPGTRIAKVPTNGDLAGQTLKGTMYLEVPVQNTPISSSILEYATKLDIFIRDVDGKIYNQS